MTKPEPLKGKWKPRGQMALAASDGSLVCPGVVEDIRSAVERWIEQHLETCDTCKNTKGCSDYLNIIDDFEDVMK